MNRLADELTQQGVSRCDQRELYRYRVFYLAYPKIVESLPPQFKSIVTAARNSSLSAAKSSDPAIGQSRRPPSGKLQEFLLETGHAFSFEARQNRLDLKNRRRSSGM
jgi:hypothetical protein